MNLEGMSKKELLDLVIELAASLKEEDLHDPETYSLVGQLLDILDDSGYTLPQEVINQLQSIDDPKSRFIEAVQLLQLHDPSQLDRLAHSMKSAGLLKSEEFALIKATPIDVTNSHILMFPAKMKVKNEDKDSPPMHVTLKWLGVDKDMDHKEVQKLVDEHGLHAPKPKKLVPVTWKSPRGDIHVLALHGDHDNLHSAHEKLSEKEKSLHPFVPHITVSKEIHDSIPAEGIDPEKLGLEIGPLEYRIGHETMRQFHPAPQAEETYTRPIELYEHHPVHNDLKHKEHYRSALKVADQGNDFKKSSGLSRAMDLAHEYAQSKGLSVNHELPVHKVDPEKAKKIADAYEAMPHNPDHPDVKAAYDAMIKETVDQYKFLRQKGLKISRIQAGQENPYRTGSGALRQDINDNHHLHYFPTEDGFGNEDTGSQKHPLLTPTGEFHEGKELLANDVFRIVHDYFGHSKEGHTFGPHGEDNAWKAHMQMYSPLARKALTTETRGQNSWVNFGPHGEKNRKQPENTIYAEQKAGLLPDWAMEHEHLSAPPQANGGFSKPHSAQTPAGAGKKPEKLAASERAKEILNKGQNGDWKNEGYTLKHTHIPADEKTGDPAFHRITAHHPDHGEVAEARFEELGGDLVGQDYADDSVSVDENHRRKGLATAMYSYAEKVSGMKIVSSDRLSEDGKGLWSQKNRPFGKSLEKTQSISSAGFNSPESKKILITKAKEILKKHRKHNVSQRSKSKR